ncbi:serine/threonine protein kinase [Solirubrobacter ginsenosidimutans]|uniref:non-specific serine/threonine protein kinase n=1 Tax=Solirubrobacter ginsenosidimutans TaxID=490573 RepID=A0A9X3MPM1_9ACTN|nr:serine/threonine-protein kinase [Solirubrobacter ginsenosidimutans]MDA0159476.1 serine/threonine protein kinase [Solirubrobacter ginsenosidimutans]
MADASDDRRIGSVIAGYRIDSRIGRGGMGVVYRAHHLSLERVAALKVIAPDLAESSGFRERFSREARVAAALTHPSIVTVYDAGEVDGTLYLAMQFIEGSDLARILATDGRLKPYRAIDVCRQIGDALDAAHERGLIHRDVKPANVLIEGRNAYLTDFGLTKRLGGTQVTMAGDVVGTIHYVAPEQIEGREVTARSDVYSLGCVLFHCLTGRMPYERDTDVAVIYAHLSEPPPRPSRVRPELPDGFDDVIAKALDKNPDRRFQTCSELMAAAKAVVESAGPLSETLPPRRASTTGAPLEEVRDARRSRVLLAGVDASTRAIAHVALGGRVDMREAASAGALDAARDARPDLVILGAAEIVGALRADPLTRDSKLLLVVDESAGRDPRAAGADERLSTPFSPLQLQVKLRKLLGADAVGA